MEANNAHVPSDSNAIKVLNLTDYDFTIRQLGMEKAPRVNQILPNDRYNIIKEINWKEDVNVAKFITRVILKHEVKDRLEKPDYIIIEVPKEHHDIVKEALEGLNIGVLYVGTTQVELKDGQVLDVKLIEQEEEKKVVKPKRILNLTNFDFTDRQIREVYDEDYELFYPSEPLEFEAEGSIIPVEYLNNFGKAIQDEINKCPDSFDCVIVDVPENITSYIARMFGDTNIRFIFTRTVLVETLNDDPFKVKLLSKVEE